MTAIAIGVLVLAVVAVVLFAAKKVREINRDDKQEEGAESCARWLERMS
jgi:Sec-independent protein translocase protein TatA